MKIQYPILILITITLITACVGAPASPIEPDVPDTATEVQNNNAPVIETLLPAENLTPIETTMPPEETASPNCLGDEVSPIGQSIADDYESATYEQVMTWFCNGAEFEDILVALETEEQTEASADEMLKMLADGFTWEEIWQLVGLTN
ncbi:MAG TPA: hypothetical protein VJ987_09655 [Anaerolineales bacterium]|nr:hypothetical protein [Anaerolineales bacterium]